MVIVLALQVQLLAHSSLAQEAVQARFVLCLETNRR